MSILQVEYNSGLSTPTYKGWTTSIASWFLTCKKKWKAFLASYLLIESLFQQCGYNYDELNIVSYITLSQCTSEARIKNLLSSVILNTSVVGSAVSHSLRWPSPIALETEKDPLTLLIHPESPQYQGNNELLLSLWKQSAFSYAWWTYRLVCDRFWRLVCHQHRLTQINKDGSTLEFLKSQITKDLFSISYQTLGACFESYKNLQVGS